MKTMEEFENALRSWVPRGPSAALRARIFGRPTVERVESAWGWNQARLAFASAVGLALVIAIRQNPPAMSASAEFSPTMLAAAMSNQTLAAYVAPQANQEWNLLTAAVECTNMGDSVVRASFGKPVRKHH